MTLIQESGLNWERGGALKWMGYWPLIYTGIYASRPKDLWLCPPQDWNVWYLKWVLKFETITNEWNPKIMEFVWDVKWWGREEFNPVRLKPVQEKVNPFSLCVPMTADHSVKGLGYLHGTLGPSHPLTTFLWSGQNGMGDTLNITDDETTCIYCSPRSLALKEEKFLLLLLLFF